MAGEVSLTRVYNDVTTLTRDFIRPLLADNITARIPTLFALNAMERKKLIPGGDLLRFPVFKEIGPAQGYTGLGTLATTEADNFTNAAYEWKQGAAPVTISGRDIRKNAGPEAVKPLLKASVEAAVSSLAQWAGGSSEGIWSTNTETTLTSLTGIPALVSDTPTVGTVGNIARSNTFWRNQTDSVTTNFSTDGLLSMQNLWTLCSFGTDHPDFIVSTRATWVNYVRSLNATLNYNLPQAPAVASNAIADLMPNVVQFWGAPMFFDDGAPANSLFMLNSKYIQFSVHPDADFELREFVIPADQDGIFSQILFQGELCFLGMRYHGRIIGGTSDTYS